VRRRVRREHGHGIQFDKMGYASDLSSIEGVLREQAKPVKGLQLLQVDSTNAEALERHCQADRFLVCILSREPRG